MSQTTINQLPLLPQQLIGEDFYVYVTTPTGGDFIAKLGEIATQMRASAGIVGLRLHTEVIQSPEILQGNTAPVTLSIPRQAGETIAIIGTPIFSMNVGSTPFATNTVVQLGYQGADVPLFTCDILGRTATGAKQGVIVTTVGDAQSQVLDNADLVWQVQGGDPTAGDGVSRVGFLYIIGS